MASVDWLKLTKPKAGAMRVHLGKRERMERNHSNKDIDKSRSDQNYFIGCDDYIDAYNAMCKRVDEVDEVSPPKRINKDRVVGCMLEAKCPQSIFDMGRSQEFFEKLYGVYKDFFGAENVHGSCVHVDEMHGYIENGVEKISLAHSHTLVSAYAEWTDKSGERKGINGKNFETKARLTALNNAVDKMCREEFGVEYLIGEGKNGKTVEQLKAESQLEKTRHDNEKLSAENQTKIKQVISDFATGKGAKKIAAAEKIIDSAELTNETLCKTNLEKEQQLICREKALEKHEAEIKSLAAYQLKRQEQLDRAAETLKVNENRLQQGFVRLKATVQREVQRALANLAPFRELFAENERFGQRMIQVQQAAEKAAKKRTKGDFEK